MLGFVTMILVGLLEGDHHHHGEEEADAFSICQIDKSALMDEFGSSNNLNVTCHHGNFSVLES